jgi:hypothetical protein
MKIAFSFIAVVLLASTVSASFIPLTLDEKTTKADLIIIGKVVSVSKLLPDNGFGNDEVSGFDGTKGSYMGPRSIAVVEVIDAWKLPFHTSFSRDDRTKRNVVPRLIMVPCDYSFHESPSELTKGRNYVLFLRAMSANMYHPIDPASTHVIYDDRVADFGMNHPPNMKSKIPGRQTFRDRSTPIEEFKSDVMVIVKSNAENEGTTSP